MDETLSYVVEVSKSLTVLSCLFLAVHPDARPLRGFPLHGRRFPQWDPGDADVLYEITMNVSQQLDPQTSQSQVSCVHSHETSALLFVSSSGTESNCT